jgi:hypothetical protein
MQENLLLPHHDPVWQISKFAIISSARTIAE